MGVRRDLKQAQQRTDLAARARVELVRDESGSVREVRTTNPEAPSPGHQAPYRADARHGGDGLSAAAAVRPVDARTGKGPGLRPDRDHRRRHPRQAVASAYAQQAEALYGG
ncbi:hypothetical protein ABT288_24380 [Streptomyces sp. NPDC001093]|uniref:hypothetical protein n=1 Tax=Streptomyces sp. NPDC001093 TaxID=3154376 RepID=UPI00331778EE